MTSYPRLMLAGVNSGAGKTTIAIALIAALKKRSLLVQPFKTGPDYIDPSYHTIAAGMPSRNLDTWILSKNTILELFQRQARHADISVIEGVMGLYDGLRGTGDGSSAHLAKITKTPVILILNAKSVSRSAGAIVLGYKQFDKDVDIRGVILNNIGSPLHYSGAKQTIERRTKLPVLGFLPKDKNLTINERHLGLVPTAEKTLNKGLIQKLAYLADKNIDIDKVIKISRNARALPLYKKRLFCEKSPLCPRATIAIAKDASFNFYYQDNIDILRNYGADIIEFSPLKDRKLPQGADGIYFGGGFPELFAQGLSKNSGLKKDIFDKAKRGMPIYAECGGLMYLAKRIIDFKKKSFLMAGVFDITVKMDDRLRGLGYINVEMVRDNVLSCKGACAKAHTFHWSYIAGIGKKEKFAYRVCKAKNDIFSDGLTKWNVLAGYAHIHFGSCPGFAENFVRHCIEYKVKR